MNLNGVPKFESFCRTFARICISYREKFVRSYDCSNVSDKEIFLALIFFLLNVINHLINKLVILVLAG